MNGFSPQFLTSIRKPLASAYARPTLRCADPVYSDKIWPHLEDQYEDQEDLKLAVLRANLSAKRRHADISSASEDDDDDDEQSVNGEEDYPAKRQLLTSAWETRASGTLKINPVPDRYKPAPFRSPPDYKTLLALYKA